MDTRKVTLIATIAVIAMVAVGVGYALTYSGSTTNSGNTANGEFLTITLDDGAATNAKPLYSGYLGGIYTLNTVTTFDTVNNKEQVLLKDLSGWDDTSDDDDNLAGVSITNFKYVAASGATPAKIIKVTTAEAQNPYSGKQIAKIHAEIKQSTDAQLTNYKVKIENSTALQNIIQQYGMSLVFLVDTGDEPITFTVSGSTSSWESAKRAFSNGVGEITLTAYVVYPSYAFNLDSPLSYTPLSLESTDITFTATAVEADPVP